MTIKNFEEYEVFEDGTVISYKSGKPIKINGCIASSGYRQVKLRNNDGLTRVYAHRLVAEYFIPNIENKPFVNHKDFNKQNNNISNLEWVTHQENVTHYNGGVSPRYQASRNKWVIHTSRSGIKIFKRFTKLEDAQSFANELNSDLK